MTYVAAAFDRAALLAEATSALALSLDVEGSLRRLARLVVPAVADWAVIDLAGEDGRPVQVAMAHCHGMDEVLVRFSELQPVAMTDEAPIMRVLSGAAPILVAHAATSRAAPYVSNGELLELCDTLGISSAMYVPMTARGRVLGCMALVSGPSGRVFSDDDLAFAADLGRRAALVVDNTRLYELEHRIAQVLQESLLPVLPAVEDLDLAAVYLPSDRAAQVGGDFYDVMALPGGSTALAVGDVIGHDLAAATAMGQIRVLLRAGAWESAAAGGSGSTRPGSGSTGPGSGSTGPGSGSTGPGSGSAGPGSGSTGPGSGSTGPGSGSTGPGSGSAGPGSGSTGPGSGSTGPGSGSAGPGWGGARSPGAWESGAGGGSGSPGAVLRRLDQLVQALELTTLATVFFALAGRAGPPGTPWTLSYASAGHPAPLLRAPDGDIIELDGTGGVALGVSEDQVRTSRLLTVRPGSVLVAFTDGLVERRNEDWDDGVRRIRAILAASLPDMSASDLRDRLASVAATGRSDDVAILVVRFA